MSGGSIQRGRKCARPTVRKKRPADQRGSRLPPRIRSLESKRDSCVNRFCPRGDLLLAIWFVAFRPWRQRPRQSAPHLRAGHQAPFAHPSDDPTAHAGVGRVATARNVPLTLNRLIASTSPSCRSAYASCRTADALVLVDSNQSPWRSAKTGFHPGDGPDRVIQVFIQVMAGRPAPIGGGARGTRRK